MKSVEIFTDGACSGNPGPGGWGAILKFGTVEKEISGFEAETTNNRMELSAVIRALELLKESCKVTITSDSAYVVNAFQKKWIESWSKNGWHKSNKESVKNVDLWTQLLELVSKHEVSWVLVKGHADNDYNNRCDELAVSAYKKQIEAKVGTDAQPENSSSSNQEKNIFGEADFAIPVGPTELIEKTVGAERLLEGKIFNIDRFTVQLPDGNTSTRDVMRHPGGAAVVAIDDNQDVLMVRQFRRAVNEVTLEIPAGKLKFGEDPMECIMRELEEETGFTAGDIELLTAMKSSPAISDEIIYVYLATDLQPGERHLDDNEFLNVETYALDVLIEQVFTGEITDAKTIAGLMLADKSING